MNPLCIILALACPVPDNVPQSISPTSNGCEVILENPQPIWEGPDLYKPPVHGCYPEPCDPDTGEPL